MLDFICHVAPIRSQFTPEWWGRKKPEENARLSSVKLDVHEMNELAFGPSQVVCWTRITAESRERDHGGIAYSSG
jgi:hypothetical protein